MKSQVSAHIKRICAMIIFGSIGIFVKNISWNSSVIALVRAAVGTLVLLLVSLGSEISIRRKEQRL